jgi:hypothetical protein
VRKFQQTPNGVLNQVFNLPLNRANLTQRLQLLGFERNVVCWFHPSDVADNGAPAEADAQSSYLLASTPSKEQTLQAGTPSAPH